jgi:uncharacterized protein
MGIQDVKVLTKPERVGRLMRIEENEITRFQFEVWFEYTRQAMTEIKEGTLLTVKNFSTDHSESHFSVLEIVSLKPVHYALGDTVNDYPGFVMEAARNIATDWTSQESESFEDSTIIRCIAAPTGKEIVENADERQISADSSIPMVGSDIRILTNDATREIVNNEISPVEELIFTGGNWLVDSSIPIYVRAEDFIRVHFGVFGFTGVGKSNLVSTVVSKLLDQANSKPEVSNDFHVKLVLFDIMSEYNVLLIDKLFENDHSFVLGIGDRTFPMSVIDYLQGNAQHLSKAALDLQRTSLYPKPLLKYRDQFKKTYESLISKGKIRVFEPETRTVGLFLRDNEATLTHGNIGRDQSNIYAFIGALEKIKTRKLSSSVIEAISNAIDQLIRGAVDSSSSKQMTFSGVKESDAQQSSSSQLTRNILQELPDDTVSTATARGNLSNFKRALEQEAGDEEISFPSGATLSVKEIVDELNNPNHSSLIIIQSHDPNELRDFSHKLGKEIFENRRRSGQISPVVSFVFDEADEFIPQKPEFDSQKNSGWIAEMLARRGRKFGLGIGICTQRTRYLKTSIMAQPHSYLVSKMPRKTDREAVQEAFGFSEEMFRQTFKFSPGDWLLASYDATGLKGVPVPIHADDANQRLKNFLQSLSEI